MPFIYYFIDFQFSGKSSGFGNLKYKIVTTSITDRIHAFHFPEKGVFQLFYGGYTKYYRNMLGKLNHFWKIDTQVLGGSRLSNTELRAI